MYLLGIIMLPYKSIYILKSDIVYVLAMSHNMCLIEIFISKLLKKKVIVDFYISSYDSLVLDRKQIKSAYRGKLLLKKEQKILESADVVIFLTQSEKRYYTSLLRIKKIKKPLIIPLCIYEHQFAKLNFSKNKTKVPTICWWGTYIPLHGINFIIDAAKILKNNGFKFELYLLGNSDELAVEYLEEINANNLNDVIKVLNFLTFNNGKLEKFLIDNCDLALGNFGDSQKAKTILANKVIDAISMKIPILTMKTDAIEDYFDLNNEINVTYSNLPEEIANSIVSIFNNYQIYVDKCEFAYHKYKKNFSPEAYNKNMKHVFYY